MWHNCKAFSIPYTIVGSGM